MHKKTQGIRFETYDHRSIKAKTKNQQHYIEQILDHDITLGIGPAGTGKTTVARALCEELGVDYIIINGSDEGRQIDT